MSGRATFHGWSIDSDTPSRTNPIVFGEDHPLIFAAAAGVLHADTKVLWVYGLLEKGGAEYRITQRGEAAAVTLLNDPAVSEAASLVDYMVEISSFPVVIVEFWDEGAAALVEQALDAVGKLCCGTIHG